MKYEVDFTTAEAKGCSSKLTIEDRIFYIKLFESPTQHARYFAGDQKGVITKEISRTEFDFWLRTLAGTDADIKEIRKKLILGKKYPR